MKMLKKLLQIRFRAIISSFAGKKKNSSKPISRARLTGTAAIFAVIGLAISAVSTLYALLFGKAIIGSGFESIYFGLFTALDFAMVFFFSVMQVKSHLFECNDNELLLSMPINPKTVVFSRLLAVLIINALESLFFLLPTVVVYGVFGGSWRGIVGGVLIIPLISLLTTSFATAVGWIVSIISKRMKRMAIFKALLAVAALIVFYKFYFGIFEMESEGGAEEIAKALDDSFISIIGLPATLHPVAFPVFAAISVACALAVFAVISKSYVSILTASYSGKKIAYKGEVGSSRSAFTSLSIKELKRFSTSTTYILNSTAGVIFTLLFIGAVVIYGNDLFYMMSNLSIYFIEVDITPALLAAIGVLCAGMSTVSASALSLEGQSLWVIKSMPIGAKTVLMAKTVPHLIINTPVALIYGIVIGIISGVGAIQTILITLICVSSSVFFAFLGIILNTVFPKFDYDNIVRPIKQSTAVGLSMFFSIIIMAVEISIGIVMGSFFEMELALSVMLILSLALVSLSAALICGKCAKKYENLTA